MPVINEIRKGTEIGYKGQAKHIWIACDVCAKCRWVQLRKGEPTRKLCLLCSNKTRYKAKGFKQRGKLSSNFKGGRKVNSKGYILVYVEPDSFFYPMADTKDYVREHRLVVAKALGRCLHIWEIVHHKHAKYPAGSVEDKQDNRYPENLQLVQEMQHNQITIFEKKIKHLEQRVTLLEAENVILRASGTKKASEPIK
ncbi:hypothetical protein LCGC14_0907430 [marine sediment metagenome]|uniref:HNH nuclease domain-containing protein n=1 Tax=marine sediment metagenome TaxID=412755 RepID=A0A0F9NUM3_9ZZZZ